jgi:phosphosulfolactate phosphohydrolase-like enzyme
MSVIREVYSESEGAKEQYSAAEIKSAEEDMLAAGFIVEILQDNLEEARKFQREARDKYIAMCGKAVTQ